VRIAFLTIEFVTEPNFSGGLASYLFRSCLALKELGHDPTIFVRSHKEQSFSYHGIEVHRVKANFSMFIRILDRFTLKKLSQPLSIVSSAITLSRKLKQEHNKVPYDIVQSTSYQATNLLVNTNIPSVVRISSFEPLWRKAYEKPLNMSQRILEWLEVKALKRADALFAPSKLIADAVQHKIEKKVMVIEPPFLIETHKLDPSVYNQHLLGKSYLLFFGTIGLMKGCKTIADMLKQLLSLYPDLFFVFIGRALEYRGRSMMEFIWERAHPSHNRVLHFDPLKHEVLYPIIDNAQAIVLPSRIDNLPNTCLEAMYFGKIVVGTKGTSFEQLIDDRESGFLCFPGRPDSLLDVTRKAIELSEEEKTIMSQKAKSRIELLEPKKKVEELIEFFRETIQNRDSGIK
jgi:glycosyltransferase involved in cell wall biosynthesis